MKSPRLYVVDATTKRPLQIDLIKYGRPSSPARYFSYETSLPLNHALFAPPAELTITEATER